MKKILLLGGSAQQVIAIETAKRLGLYTIVCDYLTDNPGQYVADKFYLTSTTDKEAILKVAREENIDGVLAYASDPAAPTAAYVAEKMNLPGNPCEAIETLCNKDRFRCFLGKNGFNTPRSEGYSDKEAVLQDTDKFYLPVIVKPVDSSGSKGAMVLHSWNELAEAVEFAFSFSRSHRIIVEEYIEKKHKYLVGGDIFVVDGRIILWGLMNCHRDDLVNKLVPVGKSYPIQLSKQDEIQVKNTLQKLVESIGFKNGAMNVELVVDRANRVFPIDIGPRSGGNMIPDLLSYIFDVDVVEMSVNIAMGNNINENIRERNFYYATHNIHSAYDGILDHIEFSNTIEQYIVRKCIYKKDGDTVEYFDNASKALGVVFFKFDSEETMEKILTDINSHIKVILK